MPQPTLAQLGNAVRSIREERGISSEALAHEAGLHRFSIYRIETGNQNPSWNSLCKIATVLDVELIEIARRATEAARSSK